MKMNKVIIAGSRSFNNYNLLDKAMQTIGMCIDEVVSGTAKGADLLGEMYAKENNIPIKKFPADWNAFGKRAGYIRNEQMAVYADSCIVFWDGESKGTKHMIDLAKKHKLSLTIFEI